MTIIFVGNQRLGGAAMRGKAIADRMGVPFYDWKNLPSGPLDTVVVVKYFTDQITNLRKRCRVLVTDPLDAFTQLGPNEDPPKFWRWFRNKTMCDVMIATSPACALTMADCGAKVVMSPHHADERIGTDWYDPNGHIVYAGGERFLGNQRMMIQTACSHLGRSFVCRFDKECWQSLKGAAISLCVRFGAERTPLNLHCKPTVKFANAARAGLRIMASDDPATTSLPGIKCLIQQEGDWYDSINGELIGDYRPSPYPWDISTHIETLRGIA